MKRSKKKQESTENIANFSEVFNSLEDELLVEMALYHPQQLQDLCIFLTLDFELAKQELEHKQVMSLN